jgi:hypothetical protein
MIPELGASRLADRGIASNRVIAARDAPSRTRAFQAGSHGRTAANTVELLGIFASGEILIDQVKEIL